MRRLRQLLLPLTVVIAAAAVPLMVRAQQPSYKGSKVCLMCHRNTHKNLVASWQKTAHTSALWPADKPDPAVKRTIVGDFAAGPGFQRSQVKWVLGRGRSLQAYLDADYRVLPKWWDVKAKAWKPATKWDPKAKARVEVGADTDARTSCLGCHTTGYDPKTADYADAGVACEACHGPGADHVAKAGKGPSVRPGKLEPARRAMICGQCHAAGADASGKYAFPVGFKPGQDLAQAFQVHAPLKGGMSQQYAEWKTSEHAQKGTVCTACHDPHGVGGRPAYLKREGNALCLSCHSTNTPDNAIHKTAAEKGKPACAMCHMPGGSHAFAKPGG